MAKKQKIAADLDPSNIPEKWPTIFTGNEVVWNSHSHSYDWVREVDHVILGGEYHCKFKLIDFAAFHVSFQSSSVKLASSFLSTTPISQPHFANRARIVVGECFCMCDPDVCRTIQQRTRMATPADAVGDSDDEQIPDIAIPPAFSEYELSALNYVYPSLWRSFHTAKDKKFQNAAGQMFFTKFGEFLILVHSSCNWYRYQSAHSTNPSGNAQPGALEVIHTAPSKALRQQSSEVIQTHQKRIADYVLFDVEKRMYCIVGEIKSEAAMEAESQNIEQMVGLFRKNQYAMLGFTCNPEFIQARVLIQDINEGVRNLRLYTLGKLGLSAKACQLSLETLAELFIAFTGVVNTTL